MLLAIDAGNSNIKIALYNGAQLVADWRVPTDRARSGEALGELIPPLLAQAGIAPPTIEAVVIACVVPEVAGALREFSEDGLRRPARFAGETLIPNIPNCYEPPSAVG